MVSLEAGRRDGKGWEQVWALAGEDSEDDDDDAMVAGELRPAPSGPSICDFIAFAQAEGSGAAGARRRFASGGLGPRATASRIWQPSSSPGRGPTSSWGAAVVIRAQAAAALVASDGPPSPVEEWPCLPVPVPCWSTAMVVSSGAGVAGSALLVPRVCSGGLAVSDGAVGHGPLLVVGSLKKGGTHAV